MTFVYDEEKRAAVDISTGAILRGFWHRDLWPQIGEAYANYEEGDMRFGFPYYRDSVHVQFENQHGRLIEANIENKATIPARETVGAYIRAYEQVHHQRPSDHQINELCERLKSGVIALMQRNGFWGKYIDEWTATFGTSNYDLHNSRVAAWEKKNGQKLGVFIGNR